MKGKPTTRTGKPFFCSYRSEHNHKNKRKTVIKPVMYYLFKNSWKRRGKYSREKNWKPKGKEERLKAERSCELRNVASHKLVF